MRTTPQLFVLSGPSGVGKSTLRRRLCEQVADVAYSVSHTSRPPRPGEVEGHEYYFVTESTFLAMVAADAFVEWARVHGNYYGTSRQQLLDLLDRRLDVILEIDVQGARQVKVNFPQACFVFILPPDWETLESRLQARGTEAEDSRRRRLQQAAAELEEAVWYDHLIVNGDLELATAELTAVVRAARTKGPAMLAHLRPLLRSSRHRRQ